MTYDPVKHSTEILRTLGEIVVKPGVKLNLPDGTPLYSANSENTALINRRFVGSDVVEIGYLKDGVFVVIEK